MPVEYTLDAEDVASARLLAMGIRPRIELALFAVGLSLMLGLSVSHWTFSTVPLLIGLTACLGAFRLTQIAKVRQAAADAYQRNPTLRRPVTATWDERGVTLKPAASTAETLYWTALRPIKENERIVLLLQKNGAFHAIPKRAFVDQTALGAFRNIARAAGGVA